MSHPDDLRVNVAIHDSFLEISTFEIRIFLNLPILILPETIWYHRDSGRINGVGKAKTL